MKSEWDISQITRFVTRLNDEAEFDKHMKQLTKDIAKRLHKMLIRNTPYDFGILQEGWRTGENYAYAIEQKGNSYEVTLYNRVRYARWVNDGHKQQPGRFIPGRWEGKRFIYDPHSRNEGGMVLKKAFVKGRFFVEKSILKLDNSLALDQIIMKELKKWFRWCLNGK